MKYLLLLYGEEKLYEDLSPEQTEEVLGAFWAYDDLLKERGALLGGEALQWSGTATTIRAVGDQVLTSDGPYAETKEQLGGYYLIEAKDLDEAIELAQRCPGIRYGPIEVRPIQTFTRPDA